MGQIVPDLVESYLATLNHLSGVVLDDIAREGAAQRLPLIDAEVGALLRVLVSAVGARRVLEIGTAIGYSGIWLAAALPPGGMLVTMEIDPERVKIAKANFARAGLSDRVNIMTGDAHLLLAKVAGPFDVIFQDGSKPLYGPLLDRLVDLLRPRGLLITDNVLWDGEFVPGFANPPRRDPADTRAIADYNDRVSRHPKLVTSIVPLQDGVAISVKRAE